MAAIKVLKREGLINRALIIAPLRVCYSVWPAEIEKWADFEHLSISIIHGDKKEAALKKDADIYVINPEGLPWLMAQRRIQSLGVDTLIVDESSKFKHPRTRRYMALKPLLSKFKRRWILTGTPAPNGLMDLFGQIYIMDLGHALGQYITHYRMTYFDQTGFGGYEWKLKPGAADIIYEKLKPMTLRLAADDYLELPEIIDNVIRVTLPPAARKIYDELEEELISEMGGDTFTAATAAAASMKCRQVANGGIYKTPELGAPKPIVNSDRWVDLHHAKVEAVQDLMEELQGHPVLIAYDFEHDRERLLKALAGPETAVIGGGTSPKKSQEIERAWNSGSITTLLGHPMSMGHGMNLQYGECKDIIWHSLTYDLELYQQFIQRVRRQGNTAKRVMVHHIVARDTVDEAIINVVRGKDKTQRALLDALKGYVRKKKANPKIALYDDHSSDYTGTQDGDLGSADTLANQEAPMTLAKKPAMSAMIERILKALTAAGCDNVLSERAIATHITDLKIRNWEEVDQLTTALTAKCQAEATKVKKGAVKPSKQENEIMATKVGVSAKNEAITAPVKGTKVGAKPAVEAKKPNLKVVEKPAAAPKAEKPAKVTAPKADAAPKASRGVHIEPAANVEDVKQAKAGTKTAKIIDALVKGVTLEELVEVANGHGGVQVDEKGVKGFLYWDVKNKGYGVKQITKGDVTTFKLTYPEGMAEPLPHK